MTTVANRIFRGGAFVFLAHVVQKGFTAIFIVIFSQLLSLRLFGELMLAMTLMNLLALISLFGLPAALQKFCSGKDTGELESHFRTISSMALLATGSVSILLWAFSQPIASLFAPTDSFQMLIAFAAVGVFTQGAFRVCYETLRAREDGKAYFIADNVLSICKLGLPIGAFFIFKNPASIMGGLALSYGVTALIVIAKLKRGGLTPHLGSAVTPKTPSILQFALPAWLAGFTYVFAQHVDKLMLGALSNAETVGLYAAASAVAMLLTLFHTAFAGIFTPIAADLERSGEKQNLRSGYTWVSKWALFTCGLGVLLYAGFGDYILRFFGEEYATADVHTVLIILGLFYLAGSAAGPAGPVLQMCGSNGLESINAVAFLVINIAANFLLIPAWGIKGAASATLIAGLARLLLQWGQLRVRHDMQIVPLPSLLTTGLAVAFTLSATAAPMFSLTRAGIALAGILALCICQFYRLEPRERKLLGALKNNNLNLTQLIKKEAL